MAQNGTSNRTGLPHGMVPFHQIADPQTRDAVMKLNENIVWLAKHGGGGSAKTVEVYKDAQELLDSIEANYQNAAAAASAVSEVLVAKADAEQSASDAAGSASDAAGSASDASGSAGDSAASASESAASAASAAASASAAAAYSWSTAFKVHGNKWTSNGTTYSNSLFYGATNNDNGIPLSAVVPDASADARYLVTVTFRYTYSVSSSTTYYFKVSTDPNDQDKTSSGNMLGTKANTLSLSVNATGADTISILAGGAASGSTWADISQCAVYMKIARLPQVAAQAEGE